MLPKSNVPTRTVTLSGGDVTVKGLTMAQVQASKGRNDMAVAFACGVDPTEAKVWLEETVAGDVTVLLEAIMALSGLGEGAQKSKRQGHVLGVPRATH